MRLLLACLLLNIFLIGSGPVLAGEGDLADLAKWVGKYPSDKIDGKTVWDNQGLKDLMGKILKKESIDILYEDFSDGPANPIEKRDGLLMMYVCKKKECIYRSSTMFIDLNKKTLSMCLVNVFDEHDTWLEVGKKPRFLPTAECLKQQGYGLYDDFHKD